MNAYAEDSERLMHWYRLACELGQEDDFKALLDSVRRMGANELRLQIEYLRRS